MILLWPMMQSRPEPQSWGWVYSGLESLTESDLKKPENVSTRHVIVICQDIRSFILFSFILNVICWNQIHYQCIGSLFVDEDDDLTYAQHHSQYNDPLIHLAVVQLNVSLLWHRLYRKDWNCHHIIHWLVKVYCRVCLKPECEPLKSETYTGRCGVFTPLADEVQLTEEVWTKVWFNSVHFHS